MSRDDATHPRELPNPADEEAFFLGQQRQDAIIVEHTIASPFPGLEYAITANPSGGFTLAWGDLIANVWEESYDELWLAYARLAVLLRAVQQERFFRNDQRWFEERATAFVSEVVQ